MYTETKPGKYSDIIPCTTDLDVGIYTTATNPLSIPASTANYVIKQRKETEQDEGVNSNNVSRL